jgi:hypothetical protein
VLAYVAGQDVPLDDVELNAALRRALFVFAAGGALNRDPALDDPAVIELAGDIDSTERRAALAAAIERLDTDPDALERLRGAETAWRAYACALLAEALGEDEDESLTTRGQGRSIAHMAEERRSGGDRRSGSDRRSGKDRRERDAGPPPEGERREDDSRRSDQERRSGKDRRSGS